MLTIAHGADETTICCPAYKDGHNGWCTSHVDESIEVKVARIEKRVDEIYAMMLKTDNAITMIVDQVKPTLDELSKSPILKMLGMKK